MTARTTHYEVVQIDVEKGEDPQEELARYMAELEGRGHEMEVVTTAPFGFGSDPSKRFRCKHCNKSVRAYFYDESASFFADFMEGEQCSKRQQNIMFALTYEQVLQVMELWYTEAIATDLDSPMISQQQYVLFDEKEVWPDAEGWP